MGAVRLRVQTADKNIVMYCIVLYWSNVANVIRFNAILLCLYYCLFANIIQHVWLKWCQQENIVDLHWLNILRNVYEVNGIHYFLMLAYKYKYALFSAYKHIIQISEHNRTEPFPSLQQWCYKSVLASPLCLNHRLWPWGASVGLGFLQCVGVYLTWPDLYIPNSHAVMGVCMIAPAINHYLKSLLYKWYNHSLSTFYMCVYIYIYIYPSHFSKFFCISYQGTILHKWNVDIFRVVNVQLV